MTSRAFLLLSVCILVGCDGSKRKPDSQLDAGQQADAGADGADLSGLQQAYCPEFARRYCAAASPCGCESVPGFGGTAACMARADAGCRMQLERFRAEPQLAPADTLPSNCLSLLDAALSECRLPAPELFAVACPLVWPTDLSRDLPGAGAPCVQGLCAVGLRCGQTETCQEPKLDAACAVDGDCLESQRCDAGRCQTLRFDQQGQTCSGPDACTDDTSCLASARRVCVATDPGAGCIEDAACGPGFFCAEGKCTEAPGLGAACGDGVACAIDLACRVAPGEGEGTCQALPKTGEPCALGRLGPFVCEAGLACRDRLCGAVPAEGERCASAAPRCQEGLGCHVEDAESVCRPRGSAGASCGLDDSCQAGLYCDFGSGRCTAFGALGSACTDGNECGPSASCVPDDKNQFRCAAQPGAGDACFLDECAEGLTCRSEAQAGVCAPPLCAAFTF